MIFRLLVFALIAYVAWKFVRGDLRRFAQSRNAPQSIAVETVKCPRCNTYVAAGTSHDCTPASQG